ncbi:hypothetical protein KAH27_01810 [bacterium]|nr:hypothetical protein [bacterium]
MEQTTEYIYKFAFADYAVIIGYLVMLISVGFIMKKMCKNVKDYFIGGNHVAWWLAGASCFMMSFSAWTFTGAAGFAYKYGILIVLLFWFNVIAFIFMGKYIAAKCRQTRKITYLQIVYDRFGRAAEQVYTYIQIPMMLFGGAIWLIGLATFVSVAFGLPMQMTIIISGAVILTYSTLSGSWGVMTTDFLQSLVLMVLTLVIGVLVVLKAGSFNEIISNVPASHLKLVSSEHSVFWIFAYFIQIFIIFTSITGAPRYLAVKDGKAASKAAYFAAALFFIGPLIWFIPPIAASYFFPDIAASLPGLANPQDGAYVLMGLSVLPHGLAGLLIMVIFAATLSSMDSAVNQNAAIICMNVYKPLIRPKASSREMFIVAHIVNVLLGLIVMMAALLFVKQKDLPLFDLMLLLAGSIGLPIALPFLLVYWVEKTPRWSAVVSTILGISFSALSKTYGFLAVPHKWATDLLNSTGLFNLDPTKEWPLPLIIGGIVLLSGGTFLLSTLAWRWVGSESKNKIEKFYKTMNTPVDSEKENIGQIDNRQFFIIGTLAMIVGSGLLLLLFTSNDIISKAAIAFTGVLIFLVGLGFYITGKKITKRSS